MAHPEHMPFEPFPIRPVIHDSEMILPISRHIFPSIPSFIEAAFTSGLTIALENIPLPRDDWDGWREAATVCMCHRSCFPDPLKYVTNTPSSDVIVPKTWRTTVLACYEDRICKHSTFGLWCYDTTVKSFHFRVVQVSDCAALVYTRYCMYEVPIPVHLAKPPDSYHPGIFWRMPIGPVRAAARHQHDPRSHGYPTNLQMP